MMVKRGVRDAEGWTNTGLGMTPGMSRTSSAGQVGKSRGALDEEAVVEPNNWYGYWAARATTCVDAIGAGVYEAAVMSKPAGGRYTKRVRAR